MTPAELHSLPAIEPDVEPDAPDRLDAGATITPYEDGPLLVRGDFVLTTPDGERIERSGHTVALCRCGKSAMKPFCDGTHKVAGFRATADLSSTRPSEPVGPGTP